MSLLFPRFAYAPARCHPVRHEAVPFLSLFDETFNEIQRASRQSRRQWNPRFDVKETKEAYSLEGELPGVDQKDINIEFTDEHTLTIKGHHESRTETGNRPEASTEKAAAETAATPSSETDTVKSHQATVEDEQPANSSAAQETSSSEVAKPTEQAPAKAEKAKQQYWISERSVGEFTRSFAFPSRVDQESVKASLKNGILSIVVPKAAAPESRRISIE